jgi:hypothetical protein
MLIQESKGKMRNAVMKETARLPFLAVIVRKTLDVQF